jgi:2-oxoglutarate dehydrogenase complex dehydrogenase (E1) component-like enzyme
MQSGISEESIFLGQPRGKCVARPAAASPATGFPKKHEKEQADVVERAFA